MNLTPLLNYKIRIEKFTERILKHARILGLKQFQFRIQTFQATLR